MSKEKQIALVEERIISKIYLIRGKKVMMDYDLSEMYMVETAQLKRQVRRNIERFPEDFMFELTVGEYESLRCQTGILKKGRGQHSKHGLMAFTEQGVAMLSSVLNSPTAIEVNIQIIRVFTRMRELLKWIEKDKPILNLFRGKNIIDNRKSIPGYSFLIKFRCMHITFYNKPLPLLPASSLPFCGWAIISGRM